MLDPSSHPSGMGRGAIRFTSNPGGKGSRGHLERLLSVSVTIHYKN